MSFFVGALGISQRVNHLFEFINTRAQLHVFACGVKHVIKRD